MTDRVIRSRRILSVALNMALRASLLAALGGCSLAPDYQAPTAAATSSYKEPLDDTASADPAAAPNTNAGVWTPASPADGSARNPWWSQFDDPLLNDLETRAAAANQNLAAAEARYRQARAAADIAGTNLFPILNLTASGVREKFSQYSPRSSGTGGGRVTGDYVLNAQTSYELDFWGRVRNTIAAEKSRAQASAADLETARLSLQTELAGDYFQARGFDAQIEILIATVDAYREALRITRNRYEGGAAAIVDVDQATTQLETAQVQLADTRLSRAQMEHAIAILLGLPPSAFALEPAPLTLTPPVIAAGLPSQLLQRRPDVAGAERQVFAANAEIGVTRAAWFPTFSLDAGFGFEAAHAGDWIEAPARMWSIGPSLALTVFDFGLRRAQNRQAIAAFDETVASYRQTVLDAYDQVEDQLAAIRSLDEQLTAQSRAVASSQHSLQQSNYRYKGGIVTYLEVASAQNAALQAREAELNLRVRRLNASLQLIKALGGDWTAALLDQPATTPTSATGGSAP